MHKYKLVVSAGVLTEEVSLFLFPFMNLSFRMCMHESSSSTTDSKPGKIIPVPAEPLTCTIVISLCLIRLVKIGRSVL